MDRRGFLIGAAVTVAAAVAGCAADEPHFEPAATPRRATGLAARPRPTGTVPAARPSTAVTSAPAQPVFRPTSGGTSVDRLPPSDAPRMALTIDDGVSSPVVEAYGRLAAATGIRLTFFVNGVNPSWTENAPLLRPMVESGQIQLGNHTWSHPDLRSLSEWEIRDQLRRNEAFLRGTYGVSSRPYLRPPYGFWDDRVQRVAADEGYPELVMWLGSLGDSGEIPAAQIVQLAQTWFLDGRIVIGHANHLPVVSVLDQLMQIVHERGLRLVTLADCFGAEPA